MAKIVAQEEIARFIAGKRRDSKKRGDFRRENICRRFDGRMPKNGEGSRTETMSARYFQSMYTNTLRLLLNYGITI